MLTTNQLSSYIRKSRCRPEPRKQLSSQLFNFLFEDCHSFPSTSKECAQNWLTRESFQYPDDDLDELTDYSTEAEDEEKENEDIEHMIYLRERLRIIMKDMKCARRFTEVEEMIEKTKRELELVGFVGFFLFQG